MAAPPKFWFAASTEEFPPSAMLAQAQAAARAGFDAVGSSDHWAPWWPEGAGSSAMAYIPAAAQSTDRPFFTAVTPIQHHYHPAVVAQYWMGLEELYPGRAILGVGSGESVNEVPTGLDWPELPDKLRRFEQGLEAITRLWAGETVTMDADWFSLNEAKLYTLAPEGRRPKLIVSAFGPKAAGIAAKYGDGLWTLGDPEQAPPVIGAYREACEREGRPVGEVVLQSGFHLAGPEEEAIARAAKWKGTQVPEVYTDDVPDPAQMRRMGEEAMTDEEFAHEGFIVSADPAHHVERLRAMLAIDGATTICLQLIGDLDPLGSIRAYGDEVLPVLRGEDADEERFVKEQEVHP